MNRHGGVIIPDPNEGVDLKPTTIEVGPRRDVSDDAQPVTSPTAVVLPKTESIPVVVPIPSRNDSDSRPQR